LEEGRSCEEIILSAIQRFAMLEKKRIFEFLPGTNKPCLEEMSTIGDAASIFREFERMEAIPILDEGERPLGIVRRSNLFESLVDGMSPEATVSEIMETNFRTIAMDSLLEEMFAEGQEQNYIITDSNGKFLSLFLPYDLSNAYRKWIELTHQEFHILINSAYNGIVAIDSGGIIRIFNESAEKITGIKAADAIGKKASKVIPNTRLDKVLKSGKTELGQKQEIGKAKIMTNRAPIVEGGKISGVIAVFQDLTELEKTIERLGEAKYDIDILETILDYAYEGITVIDKNGKIVYFNKANSEMLGIKPEEAIGKNISDVIPVSRLPIVLETGIPEIRAPSIYDENRIVNRIPITRDGYVLGAVAMVLFKDIADLKGLYEKLAILESKVEYYKKELENRWISRYTIDDIIGDSETMRNLKRRIPMVAKTDSTVLVTGETGTGKELFAHAIHNISRRKNGPFVRVNCASIPRELLEAELFGYEPGAFTGARKGGMLGKFELADGGTIFLDEISDMPLSMQAELLRVLQEKEIIRVGGVKPTRVNFRVIAATNQDPDKLTRENKFRADLFYRLDVIRIDLPPLRKIKDEIPRLAAFFAKKFGSAIGKSPIKLSPRVLRIFESYEWPGNIRELANVIEQSIASTKDGLIDLENLPPRLFAPSQSSLFSSKASLKDLRAKSEKKIILEALKMADGNKVKTARLLRIHRSGLYQKLRKYDLA
jgi:PAS domain S-box-containing protein